MREESRGERDRKMLAGDLLINNKFCRTGSLTLQMGDHGAAVV